MNSSELLNLGSSEAFEDLFQDLSNAKAANIERYEILNNTTRDIVFSGLHPELDLCHLISSVIDNDNFDIAVEKIHIALYKMCLCLHSFPRIYDHDMACRTLNLYINMEEEIISNLTRLIDILSNTNKKEYQVDIGDDIAIGIYLTHICEELENVKEKIDHAMDQLFSYIIPKEDSTSKENNEEEK